MQIPEWFQRPLIPLALAAFLGCLGGEVFTLTEAGGWCLAASTLLAAVLWRRTRWLWPLLPVAAFFAFYTLAVQARCIPADDISTWSPQEQVRLEGSLDTWPETDVREFGWKAVLQCSDRVDARGRHPVSGKVRFHLPGPCPSWNPGDHISVVGKLSSFSEPSNPAEFDYAHYQALQGVRAFLSVHGREDAVWQAAAPGLSVGRIGGTLHAWLTGNLRTYVPRASRAMLVSLVMGDRSGLSYRVQESMAAAGLSHIFAVSGMNVAMVFAVVYAFGKICRLPIRLTLAAGVLVVWLFTLAAGSSASVVRAAVMASGVSLGVFLKRRTDPQVGPGLGGFGAFRE